MAPRVRRGARTQHDKLEKYIKLQRSLLGETVFTAVQFNSLGDRFASPRSRRRGGVSMKEQSCRIVPKDATLQRRRNGVRQRGKLGPSSSDTHRSLFPSLSSLLLVFCPFVATAHRAPSGCSRRGAIEVLIGGALANGEHAPTFAPGRAGTKEMKRWRGVEPSRGNKRGEGF